MSWRTSLKIDPLEFRLKNLKDERLRAVLDAAAQSLRVGQSQSFSRIAAMELLADLRKGGYVANLRGSGGGSFDRQGEGRARRDRLRVRRESSIPTA